jgi:uncharacterized membrane protein YccC
MIYLAFIFALALACIAGMEFVYLIGLETKNRQLKRRVKELERENRKLYENLRRAEELEEQRNDEESWPELIDDSSRL